MAQTHSTTSKRTFKHLTPYDRGKIAALHSEGKSLQSIANVVGCHKSTISRELKRGTVNQLKSDRTMFKAYFPDTGQLKYEQNRKACGAKMKLDEAIEFIQFAEKKILHDNWSPDAVSVDMPNVTDYLTMPSFVQRRSITILTLAFAVSKTSIYP